MVVSKTPFQYRNTDHVLIALAFVIILAVIIGFWMGKSTSSNKISPEVPPIGRMCTADAMICPDGTAVGRTGPNCDFAPCPGS